MITTALTTDMTTSVNFTKNFAQLLSNIDYAKMSRVLRNPVHNQTHKVVLLEYVNSGCYEIMAEFQRIPGTTITIDDFLNRQDTKDALNTLFANKPNMMIYTRRKIKYNQDGSTNLTKFKQLVLKITPVVPSPILNPEDEVEDEVEEFDLNTIRIMR